MSTKDSKSSDPDDSQQRRHYRIRFPIAERPVFEFNGKHYVVLDLSEQGLSFAIESGDSIAKNTKLIAGRIVFNDKEAVNVTGTILRKSDEHVVLVLKQGIPLSIVMKQQRLLLQKYGQIGT